MPTCLLRLSAEEIVRVVRAEMDAAGGQPELYVGAWQDYGIEEDYDRSAYGLHDGAQYDLVTVEGNLNIEPRIERNYWILSVAVRREIGPRIIGDENALLGAPLMLDEFESGFRAQGEREGVVSLYLTALTRQG